MLYPGKKYITNGNKKRHNAFTTKIKYIHGRIIEMSDSMNKNSSSYSFLYIFESEKKKPRMIKSIKEPLLHTEKNTTNGSKKKYNAFKTKIKWKTIKNSRNV